MDKESADTKKKDPIEFHDRTKNDYFPTVIIILSIGDG